MFLWTKLGDVNSCVLMNGRGLFSFTLLRRGQEAKPASLLPRVECDLLVPGFKILGVGQDPDLEEMHLFDFGRIELAVYNTAAGRHQLHFIRTENISPAGTVAMQHLALEHIRQDFHVPMGMWTEACPGSNSIVVNNPQDTKSHMLGVVIVSKGKGEKRFQPTAIAATAVLATSNR